MIHSADVTGREVEEGDIAFTRRMLGAAAGCARIGVSHYAVPPGARQMPVHVHGDEEEIFFVLSGAGISWQRDGAWPVGPGDTIVHRPLGKPHTFLAGDQGLELLAFASGSDTSITYLPRAQVMWCGPRWVPLDAPHPFRAEGQAGPLERPELDPSASRPAHVVALEDAEPLNFPGADTRVLGRTAGAQKAGLNHLALHPGVAGPPLHCHSLEEEFFYVLAGEGTLLLGEEEHPLVAGDVVARPPSTGIPHEVRAGAEGLVYLVYGTREPGDSVYYPRTGQVRLRGLGVTLAVDQAGKSLSG